MSPISACARPRSCFRRTNRIQRAPARRFSSSPESLLRLYDEVRFRTSQRPSGRSVKVIDLDHATHADVQRLITDIPSADLVVMVVTAGNDASAAAEIGQVCSDCRVMTQTIVVRAKSVSDEVLSRTLAQVRPWSLMLVVASDEAYVEEILRAFR